MRVVQVNYAFDRALRSADELLDRYATLTGWADAIARAGADVLTVQQFRSSANVTRAGLPYTFGDFGAIRAATAAFGPDVVHVNGLGFAAATWRLRRALGRPIDLPHPSHTAPTPLPHPSHTAPTPLPHPSRTGAAAIVVQDHASGLPPRDGFLRARVRRRLMRAADAFLFSTLDQARPWRARGYIREAQRVYDVMEASTDLRPIDRGEARRATGVDGSPSALWVGRLNANKDPLTVLDAFEPFIARHAGATLTMIYREEDLIDRVRARVTASPPLRDRVRLVGAVPHDRIAAYYSAADIFVVGSHHEGSGYALIEAIACGATPVVTDIPPFRALTAGGSIGALWTSGDPSACASALGRAVDQIDRARAIDHFERNLTWTVIGQRAVAIYADVLANMAGG